MSAGNFTCLTQLCMSVFLAEMGRILSKSRVVSVASASFYLHGVPTVQTQNACLREKGMLMICLILSLKRLEDCQGSNHIFP